MSSRKVAIAPISPVDPISVTLTNGADIPNAYENSDHFRIRWSYDGRSPLTSDSERGVAFSGGYPGDEIDYGTGANWLDFDGASFQEVSQDERFLVGQLDFFNGTISLNSVATAVDFSVALAFDDTTRNFDFSFDLLTTPNNGTAWENADYVWFNDTVSSQSVNLYGVDYTLNLEFGETTSYGFSSIDQFHVQEAQAASVNLYATLVSLDAWWQTPVDITSASNPVFLLGGDSFCANSGALTPS